MKNKKVKLPLSARELEKNFFLKPYSLTPWQKKYSKFINLSNGDLPPDYIPWVGAREGILSLCGKDIGPMPLRKFQKLDSKFFNVLEGFHDALYIWMKNNCVLRNELDLFKKARLLLKKIKEKKINLVNNEVSLS